MLLIIIFNGSSCIDRLYFPTQANKVSEVETITFIGKFELLSLFPRKFTPIWFLEGVRSCLNYSIAITALLEWNEKSMLFNTLK